MPTYEYFCAKGHGSEVRRGYEVSSIPCLVCGEKAQRNPCNTPFIHGAGPAGLTIDQLSPERFLDRAEYIDDAYVRADKETGEKVKRPMGFKAGIVRARALQIEREGADSKAVHKLNELDQRAV